MLVTVVYYALVVSSFLLRLLVLTRGGVGDGEGGGRGLEFQDSFVICCFRQCSATSIVLRRHHKQDEPAHLNMDQPKLLSLDQLVCMNRSVICKMTDGITIPDLMRVRPQSSQAVEHKFLTTCCKFIETDILQYSV